MINIEETNLKEEMCKYFLPCGLCEFTKNKCTKYMLYSKPMIINNPGFIAPIETSKEYKIGDWPPGPQPTCKDLASNPDTFRVHFEDLPKYSTSDSRYNNSSSTIDMYNLSGTLKSN